MGSFVTICILFVFHTIYMPFTSWLIENIYFLSVWDINMILKVRAIEGNLPPKASVPSLSFYPVLTPPSFPLGSHPLPVGNWPHWFLVYSSSTTTPSFPFPSLLFLSLCFFSFSVAPPLSPPSTNKQIQMYFLFLFFLHEAKYSFAHCFFTLKFLFWNQSIRVHGALPLLFYNCMIYL